MQRFTTGGLATLFSLAICAIAMAQPGFEISMPNNVQTASDDSPFASKQEAEAYLSRFLPIATAGNPKYRSPNGGTETAWITRAVKFGHSKNPTGISVSMSEEVLEFRHGIRSATGAHEVAFQIEDVKIAERKDSGDVTEKGEPALGIIFNCHSGQCIQSTRDGKQSASEWADIYIQDATLRAKILKAFETLKQGAGDKT
jgi:hypothetical protein